METNEFDQELLNKIDSGEKLSERDLRDLLEYEIQKDEGEGRRWSRSVDSLLEIGGRLFVLNWEQGLTENCDDGFFNQPVEVFKQDPYKYEIRYEDTNYLDESGKLRFNTI